MKKLPLIISFFSIVFCYSQKTQIYAPWSKDALEKNNNNPTLEQVSAAANDYFEKIDEDKKGSGIKPFERWRYHWKYFLDNDGKIQSKEKLWEAWEQKNNFQNKSSDLSNWSSLGPYSHKNTASWSSGQGRVNVVAVDPNNENIYYVGTPAGGIWKSIDAGINWIPLTDYLPQIGVSGIAIDPSNSNTIFIATGDDDANDSYAVGVWKSIDGGVTWNPTGSLSGNPNSMNEIYIFPDETNSIMVATSTGVHKSTNGGSTWVRKLAINARSLKMKPGDASTWYSVSSNSFYKSTNFGETFQNISINDLSGASRLEIDVTPANSEYVYIVKAGENDNFDGIFKSTNSGLSFDKTAETSDIFGSTQSWYDLALAVSDTDENTLFVGVLNIWKSIDGGNNFSQLNSWNSPNSDSYTHADIHYLRYINGKFFAGTDGGVYVSENDGTNFNDLTENLAIGQFYKISVAIQNSENIVGGLQDNGGYALNNEEWLNYYGADGMDCVVNPTNSNNYFGFTQYGGTLYETIDAGLTRTGGISSPETGSWVTPLVSNSEGEIFAGYSQIYQLQNNSWQQISSHNFGGNLTHIKIDPNNSNNIYATRGSSLFKSHDKGITFENVTLGLGSINAIEINSLDSNIIWIATSSGVFKITDILESNPTNEMVGANIGSKLSLKHHQRSGNNTLYLGTGLGVYTFNDDISIEWERFDTNLPNVAIRDLEINEEDSKLYAATYGRGVFVTDIPRQLPPSDIRLLSIENPTGINCNENLTPSITIKNQGLNTITSATINYNIDNNDDEVYEWSGSLNSEDVISINLPQIIVDELGSHEINIEVTTLNDFYSENNSITNTSFIINTLEINPTSVNSFENSDDSLLTENLNSDDSLWVIGSPSKSLLNSTGSGNLSYITKENGNYPNNTTGYLYSSCYDLSQISSPVLSFKMAFDIEENWDYLTVEYSINSGVSWQILGSASESNWYNSSSTENGMPGNQWTGEGEDTNSLGGTNATIHDYNYDLSEFSTESNIIFRFKFFSDGYVNEEGVVVDDLVINGEVLSVNYEDFSNTVSISPNPSNNIFNIKWSTNNETSINVYNLLGQKVHEKNKIDSGSYLLDLGSYKKGIYILKINSNGQTTSRKIILY